MMSYEEAKKEMRSDEVVLNGLLREYHTVSTELNVELHNINEEISNLTEIRNSLAKPYQDRLADIEAQIRIPMFEYQHTFINSVGKINYRKGATRRLWNLDALDQICEAKPEVKNEIWAFREEKIGEPTISIKLNEGD